MRVLAVVPSIYDTSPGQRFRLEQWEPLLKDGGVSITYRAFETDELRKVLYQNGRMLNKLSAVTQGLVRRQNELRDVRDFDVVYVFREAALLGPPFFEKRMARTGVPIVFDFDDAIFHSYRSPSNGYLSYLKFPGKTGEICRLSSHVMAGNQYLADYASRFNKNVTIVPTTIDTEKYAPRERAENETPVIGWSGSFSTVQHLDTLRDVLAELAKRERFKLRVIGTPEYEIPGVDVEAIKWRAESELEDLGAIDVGIMPLPDDKWSQGKCGLKALQYMALGIPPVCSSVGVNSKIIKDGENGYLADQPEQWLEKLTRLLHSASLRRHLGSAARGTVEKEYSAAVQAPRVLRIFESVTRAKVS
jgi:glycosyltransferase involved in cell wall biosynthesis